MAAATDDVAAVTPDFLDINIDDDLNIDDVVRDLDLDFDFGDVAAADEFRDAYAAFLANADANGKIVGAGGTGGWIAGPCGGGGGGEGSSEGSTGSSAVTDDGGALAGDEDVSEFVAELERFLMDDDGDGKVETTEEEEAFCPDDFFGDLLATTSGGFDGGVATGALPHNGEVVEEDNAVVVDDGDVLAARENEQASRKRARYE